MAAAESEHAADVEKRLTQLAGGNMAQMKVEIVALSLHHHCSVDG